MTDETITTTGIAAHGASRLPWVEIDSFNLELKDEDGLLGDRANKAAFWENLEEWRKPLRKSGEDPFGNEPSENISKKDLDAILAGDDAEASAVVHSAVEDFAQELVHVTRRFLKTKAWDRTERIVVGGGFRASRLRRTGHRACRNRPQGREHQGRATADPSSPGRRRPHRRAASRSILDFRSS
jgi:hypothetical protein